jgi:hypothetical protein
MLIVLAIAIPTIWIAAILLRRRYIRKKEREIEMRPPVAIGPHQVQAMSGGYSYGDGVVDASGKRSGVGGRGGGANKGEKGPAGVVAMPADNSGQKEQRGWLRKDRK